MTQFTVVNLPEDKYDVALPLVRMSAPLTTLHHWREFVRTLFAGTGGILGAFAADDRPLGIAAYCPDHTLLHGRVLRVEPLVTFEVNRAAPVRSALCETLEALARDKACEAIILSTGSRGLVDANGPKSAGWTGLGFDLASVDLVKRVDRPSWHDLDKMRSAARSPTALSPT
jgi:hypothetical protein